MYDIWLSVLLLNNYINLRQIILLWLNANLFNNSIIYSH